MTNSNSKYVQTIDMVPTCDTVNVKISLESEAINASNGNNASTRKPDESNNSCEDGINVSKKKKTKKKLSAYKQLLKQSKTSRFTDAEKKQNHRNAIAKSLGGGTFSKSEKL